MSQHFLLSTAARSFSILDIAKMTENRVDRRRAENQNPNKRCIIVIREREDGVLERLGSRRTLTYVLHNENPFAKILIRKKNGK